MSPATVIELGRLGGLGVLDLEGLWTRYEDPESLLAEISAIDAPASTSRLQEIYAEEVPVIGLFWRSNPYILPKWLKGVRPTGQMASSTLWIEDWAVEGR